jgi:hypothetical protein
LTALIALSFAFSPVSRGDQYLAEAASAEAASVAMAEAQARQSSDHATAGPLRLRAGANELLWVREEGCHRFLLDHP